MVLSSIDYRLQLLNSKWNSELNYEQICIGPMCFGPPKELFIFNNFSYSWISNQGLSLKLECPTRKVKLEQTLLIIQRKSERRGLHPKTWGMNCQMLRRNYERCLFMGISSIIHIVFGPEHCLKLGASSKCANKLLGLLRKGVADMSPPIKIVLQCLFLQTINQ